MNTTGIWLSLMRLGSVIGCHQREDRSFSVKGCQFPVCARCTGVIIGQTAGAICFAKGFRNIALSLAGCGTMLADWLVQRVGIRESTNKRRLLTGFVGGFGLGVIYLAMIRKIIFYIKDLIK